MLSFCPKCQLDIEPWETLTFVSDCIVNCGVHGNMNADSLMSAKAELDAIGKNLHYLIIAPDQSNEGKHNNSLLPQSE